MGQKNCTTSGHIFKLHFSTDSATNINRYSCMPPVIPPKAAPSIKFPPFALLPDMIPYLYRAKKYFVRYNMFRSSGQCFLAKKLINIDYAIDIIRDFNNALSIYPTALILCPISHLHRLASYAPLCDNARRITFRNRVEDTIPPTANTAAMPKVCNRVVKKSMVSPMTQ